MPDSNEIIDMKKLFRILEIAALLYYAFIPMGLGQSYSTYSSIDDLMAAEDSKYADFIQCGFCHVLFIMYLLMV